MKGQLNLSGWNIHQESTCKEIVMWMEHQKWVIHNVWLSFPGEISVYIYARDKNEKENNNISVTTC